MSEKYKIGDVSRLLGIPAQTLRYYEEQGIIHPKKNESTGYRYYDAWDLNSLMDLVYYRSLDFPLTQIEEMLNSDSLGDKLGKYAQQEIHILHKLEQYNSILSVLTRQRQRLQLLSDSLGRLSVRPCPGVIFFRHRMRNRFQSADGDTDFTELKEGMKQWIDTIREITPTFLFNLSSLQEEDSPQDLEYWWGWSIPVMAGITKGMEPTTPNEFIPSCRCLYTVFQAGGEGTFASTFYNNVYKKVLEQPHVISASPFGRLILKAHENGGLRRYFEVWFPIE